MSSFYLLILSYFLFCFALVLPFFSSSKKELMIL